MGKEKNAPRLGPKEARAYSHMVRSSARKLNLVAAMIRRMPVEQALNALAFSPRRIAVDVRKVLQSAIANAENNHELDVDRLVVAEAYVGRTLVMKRVHARGRGRSAGIEKPYSNLTIIVRQQEEAE